MFAPADFADWFRFYLMVWVIVLLLRFCLVCLIVCFTNLGVGCWCVEFLVTVPFALLACF